MPTGVAKRAGRERHISRVSIALTDLKIRQRRATKTPFTNQTRLRPRLDGARQRPLETCHQAFPRPRLALILLLLAVARLEFFTYRLDHMCGRVTLRSRDRIRLKGIPQF